MQRIKKKKKGKKENSASTCQTSKEVPNVYIYNKHFFFFKCLAMIVRIKSWLTLRVMFLKI